MPNPRGLYNYSLLLRVRWSPPFQICTPSW
jgi:hypothetical protein